ncbi:MAG TPA: hypothetical protein DC064_21650 [Cyanobacteria bacterium UBA9273]|nr:hypothetical protein [Cyanobacteria bacterium UBA9273]
MVIGNRKNNPSPITHHPSPITHHPSPITHHPLPITHYPSPISYILRCFGVNLAIPYRGEYFYLLRHCQKILGSLDSWNKLRPN